MKKRVSWVLSVVLLWGLGAGCAAASSSVPVVSQRESLPVSQPASQPAASSTAQATPGEVVDLLGRTVALPDKIDKIAVIGVGALRLYCYSGDLDKLVGVEEVEQDETAVGRPYTSINQARFMALPVLGQGGPKNTPDAEKLVALAPDLVLSTYAADAAEADELQEKLQIPVVCLQYGKEPVFGDSVKQSILLVGEICAQQEKAQSVVDLIEDCYRDLQQRTADIPEEEKPGVYIGALGSKGAHGIESTQGGYDLFEALHVKNVVDETGQKGSVMIDREQLLQWDPQVIFLDCNGYPSVEEDLQLHPDFYQSLSAVQNKEVYGLFPYNFLHANIDTALGNAYRIGKTLYPEAFADVDPAAKADEIYTIMLGQPFYEQMEKDFSLELSVTK